MKLALVLLLVGVLAWPVEPSAERTFRIHNVSGPLLGREGDFRLRIQGNHLSIQDHHTKKSIEIAGTNIIQVLYTPLRFSRVEQVPNPIGTPCFGSDVGCGGAALFLLAAALIVSPMHGRKHYVRITWVDRSVEQQVEFELGKDDYQPVLEALKDFSGVKYADLEVEGRHVRSELEQNAANAITFHLDRPSRVGTYDLAAGDYQFVALARAADHADVYIFPASNNTKFDPSTLKAVARATLLASDSPDSVEYATGSQQVQRIAANGKSFLFNQ